VCMHILHVCVCARVCICYMCVFMSVVFKAVLILVAALVLGK